MMKRPERTKKSVNQSLICSPLFFVYLIATKCLNVDGVRQGSQSKKENEYVHWSRKIERERKRKRPTNNRICCRSILSCHFLSSCLYFSLSRSYPFSDLFLFFLSLYACPICLQFMCFVSMLSVVNAQIERSHEAN
jgi:hypothetical protein